MSLKGFESRDSSLTLHGDFAEPCYITEVTDSNRTQKGDLWLHNKSFVIATEICTR